MLPRSVMRKKICFLLKTYESQGIWCKLFQDWTNFDSDSELKLQSDHVRYLIDLTQRSVK